MPPERPTRAPGAARPTPGRELLSVLWSTDAARPPWLAGPRWLRRAVPVAAALYALVVAIAASSLVNDSGRMTGGLFFLLELPAVAGVAVAAHRPLDGWRTVTVWLVLVQFVLPKSDAALPPLEPWEWCLWVPVLLAVAWTSSRLVTVAVAVVSLLALGLVGLQHFWPQQPGSLVVPLALLLLPLALGAALGSRWDARRALAAEQARTAEAQAARGALAERARIAREMHDVVAHHLSLVAVRCETAPYRLAPLEDRAAAELAEVAETARQALQDLQRLLGVLRTEDQQAERAPQPGAAALPRLLDDVRAAGTDLEAHLDDLALPDTLGLTVYRVVQQALANAAQHAPGAPVRVAVTRSGPAVRVEVVNGPGVRPGTPGAGQGLVGMRERVAVHGGRLDAERTADGGFRVCAELLLAGPVAAAHGEETR
ncbi:two-component sensor histidine kinase [Geodermatophilus sabuli]|uniref:histidine kinase n=1 Tax=Geodermatophilus sabuli TaxID=1564158 RepID=A0A7K3VYA8_9ACTN|nr:histidine kinase [Geodermatophilus sabuli]NEK57358.1 two-component sensor histidine kinase [Geodermatophilus sabuli]